MKPTKAQQQALLALYHRSPPRSSLTHQPLSFLQFRRTAFIAFKDCLMVPWCSMIVGIETDGYTHS